MKTTIVIADRDIVMLELLRSRCVALGLNVETAARGDDALASIDQLRPHVVCVDQALRCADGRTVCEALAGSPELARIPVIMLGDRRDERGVAADPDVCSYFVPRSGNLWHRIEPLIYELTDLPLLEPRRAEPRVSTAAATHPPLTRPSLAGLEDDKAEPSSFTAEETDERESVLEAVFAWFGAGDEATESVSAPGGLRGPHTHDPGEPPWVLCIEDDCDFSLALKLRLEAHGVAVVRAFDGTAGYRAAFTHPASAILLDYNLPQGQGDYVLRRLKENPVTADVPVIVITGNHSTAIRRQMFNLGADAYLTKPLNFADLFDVLENYVDLVPAEYAVIA
jgi:DNA-binding response OmpR family regulator